MAPALSICIPTYQRLERVISLVRVILGVPGALEICVHVDGGSDGSYEALATLAATDHRLRVTRAPNQGRAKSLAAAVQAARGRYVMFYDDDDEIFPDALAHVISMLAEPLPAGCCGYVFQMTDQRGELLGAPLPRRSNFLRLRADEGVEGDKKEVVDRAILLANFYKPRPSDRRIPTSTLWSRLALRFDVLGDNTPLGRKDYLQGGYTNQISKLKAENPRPMMVVNAYRAAGFIRGRYRSTGYFFRSVVALAVYSARTLELWLRNALAARSSNPVQQARG